jgi:transposase
VAAPEDLRHRLRDLPTKDLVAACARFRPGNDLGDVQTATKFALRSVARRHEALSEEIAELDVQLDHLVAEVAPGLIVRPAIGTHHAATLLVLAGDNPERLDNEASFASLCGVSPVEASSGKVVRHRLNRGGDRDANRALHMICVVRMGSDPRTRDYVSRRTAEGKSKREIMRCLKRYIARRSTVSWSHLPRHHHPPGAVYEQHYGTPDDLALDYKSVTLSVSSHSLFGGSVHYEIRLGSGC